MSFLETDFLGNELFLIISNDKKRILQKVFNLFYTEPMESNIKYKSTVFSTLFSDPNILRELYYAIKGIPVNSNVPITINTLENVLFMDMMNDISFEIGGKLIILIEHQSTINPNMALRLLMYIARIYERLLKDKKNLYTKKLIPIPQPEFFVLYNGISPYPDESIIKLSDAFVDSTSIIPDKNFPTLELIVKVLNINEGKNQLIVQKCKTLSEYSAFVAKVREFEKLQLDRETAIKEAVKYCHDHDVLKEFLEKHGKEVFSMLFAEWKLDEAKEVWQEEAKEEEREKWQSVVAEKDAENERLRKLLAQLGK
jgi:hypothetical protein